MVLFLSFSQKFGSQSQIFVKKDVQFRPAAGESGRSYRQMPDLHAHRVTCVSEIDLRSAADERSGGDAHFDYRR
jgi:hypothetical protein